MKNESGAGYKTKLIKSNTTIPVQCGTTISKIEKIQCDTQQWSQY
jgi:hypothetical protein